MHPDAISPPRFFRHLRIKPASGGLAVPFVLWAFQREVLEEMRRRKRLIFLKARQLGLSWLALGYALWLANCNAGMTVLILNRNQATADELLERIYYMWKRLPEDLKTPLMPLTGKRRDQLTFSNDSKIMSLPATEDAGSGETAHLIIVDEWAKIALIRELMAAIIPTLAAGGQLFGISTAKGYHNHFAEEWRGACDGSSDYYPVFIPWHAHPDRDEAWYEAMSRSGLTARKMRQEFPATAAEAFVQADDMPFELFDRLTHCTTELYTPDSPWPVFRGVDFGYHVAPVYWFTVEAKRNVFVFDELILRKSTTENMARAIVQRDKELGLVTSNVPAGTDPAGKAQTSAATLSDIAVLNRHGIPTRDSETTYVNPSDRVDLINVLLGEDRLRINARKCPMLVEAFERAEWDRVGGKDGTLKETYRKDGKYEHPLDGFGYGLINAIPQRRGALAGVGGPTAGVARGYR